jgi:hypothetical protein
MSRQKAYFADSKAVSFLRIGAYDGMAGDRCGG